MIFPGIGVYIHSRTRGVYCILAHAQRKINQYYPGAGPTTFAKYAMAHVQERTTTGYTDVLIEGANVNTYTSPIE